MISSTFCFVIQMFYTIFTFARILYDVYLTSFKCTFTVFAKWVFFNSIKKALKKTIDYKIGVYTTRVGSIYVFLVSAKDKYLIFTANHLLNKFILCEVEENN